MRLSLPGEHLEEASPERPSPSGYYSSAMTHTAQEALGKRGPLSKTSCQASGTEEGLYSSPNSLPNPAGSRKAKGAAGKLECKGANPLQAEVAFGLC